MTTAVRHQARGRPRSRSYQVAHRVSRRFDVSLARTIDRAVFEIRAAIDTAELASAVESGATASVLETMLEVDRLATLQFEPAPPIADEPPRFFAQAEDVLFATIAASGNGAGDLLADGLDVPFEFNGRAPALRLYAREHARLIRGIMTEDIRDQVVDVLALDLEPVQKAEALQNIVGLPPNWTLAPARFAEELREGQTAAATSRVMGNPLLTPLLRARDAGRMSLEIERRIDADRVTEPWLRRIQAEYSRNLVRARAMTIARTETIGAANEGMRQSWG